MWSPSPMPAMKVCLPRGQRPIAGRGSALALAEHGHRSRGSAGSATIATANSPSPVPGRTSGAPPTRFSLSMFMFRSAPIATSAPGSRALQNTSGNAKAAVMIRESLAANSGRPWRMWNPLRGIEFLFRTNTGGHRAAVTVSGQPPPNWVRLTRTNNTFTAYWSPDGNSWT
jgi:hypothetical protein